MDESAFIVARAIVDAAIASRGTYQATVGQLEQLGFFARQGVKVRLKAIQPKDDGKTWLLGPSDNKTNFEPTRKNLIEIAEAAQKNNGGGDFIEV